MQLAEWYKAQMATAETKHPYRQCSRSHEIVEWRSESTTCWICSAEVEKTSNLSQIGGNNACTNPPPLWDDW